MGLPNIEKAHSYVRHRLENELPERMVYHSLYHTFSEVLPAVDRLAVREGLNELDHLLLRTAAFFHDLGFVERYQGHEEAGARIAGEILPGLGFDQTQTCAIQAMILATRLPQSPATLLEEILADADLDVLGKEDFIARNRDLRVELESQGRLMSDESWYGGQLQFLRNHRYFTGSARQLRGDTKAKNIQQLEQIYQACLQNQPD